MDKRKFELAPSILSANFACLGAEIESARTLGIRYLHLDVMDGIFVPNISFGIPVIKSVRKSSDMIFDVHLMITEPERYVEDFAKAGADFIVFHSEATEDIRGTINKIKSLGKKAGVAIKPKTSIEDIREYLGDIDLALVMSVEPGFGGQKLIEHTLQKVAEIRKIIDNEGYGCLLEIDGGINEENIGRVRDAGCDIIVAGSAFFGSTDRRKTYENMMNGAVL